MQYDKKLQFGGWNRQDYKFIRAKLRRFYMADQLEEVKTEKMKVCPVYFDDPAEASQCDSCQ